MNERMKLFLLFQTLPVCLLLVELFLLHADFTRSYHMWGEITTPLTTNYQAAPEYVINIFLRQMELVAFVFFAGIPFELWLLFVVYPDDKKKGLVDKR